MSTISIDARFNGPPSSGHGGYSAGLVGTAVGGPAEVTLLAPPPLGTALAVTTGPEGAELRDGDRVIATAVPSAVDVGPAPQVPLEAVRRAMPDPDELRRTHPFPTCFGCGPDRAPGDGLRLFAGPVAGTDGVWGAVWRPDGAGPVEDLWVWAALDCPSSGPAQDPTGTVPIVLGRLAIDVRAAVPAGEDLAILSRELEHRGRRHVTAVWLVDGDGHELAAGRATWIELKPQDAAQRRGDGR